MVVEKILQSLMTINYVVCSIEESMNENLSSNNTLSNNTLNNQTRKIKEKLVAKETKMVDSHTFKDYLF